MYLPVICGKPQCCLCRVIDFVCVLRYSQSMSVLLNVPPNASVGVQLDLDGFICVPTIGVQCDLQLPVPGNPDGRHVGARPTPPALCN